ncbi:HD domain-containing protein [Alphaproteobacteria bacterium]|nr:HD domain-containing protein [Alphaproteobacteria bacterium]
MSQWPDDFDFDTDETCQSVFKPFIINQIQALESYNAQRPKGHVYQFHKHAERVARNVGKTCVHMGLGKTVANNMYWAVLPHDIGKMSLPVSIWDVDSKPDEFLKSRRRTHTILGKRIVDDLLGQEKHLFKDLMVDIMLHHHEKMDGTGQHGVMDHDLSLPVRLTCIADSYDGWRIRRPHYDKKRDTSPRGVIQRIREEKGEEFFDMEIVDQFEAMKMAEYKANHEPF